MCFFKNCSNNWQDTKSIYKLYILLTSNYIIKSVYNSHWIHCIELQCISYYYYTVDSTDCIEFSDALTNSLWAEIFWGLVLLECSSLLYLVDLIDELLWLSNDLSRHEPFIEEFDELRLSSWITWISRIFCKNKRGNILK